MPTNNLIEGMRLRTVSTKAQDGPQHPGADALEVVKPLADSTGGDVYVCLTDIHRGFPYQRPSGTPAEKLALFRQKVAKQVDQVLKLAPEYRCPPRASPARTPACSSLRSRTSCGTRKRLARCPT